MTDEESRRDSGVSVDGDAVGRMRPGGTTVDDATDRDGRDDATDRDARDDVVEDDSAPDEALLSRLELIEDQPLADRSEAYLQVHDELRDTLESGDRTAGA